MLLLQQLVFGPDHRLQGQQGEITAQIQRIALDKPLTWKNVSEATLPNNMWCSIQEPNKTQETTLFTLNYLLLIK